MDMLRIGLSSLMSTQQGLAVASNNIANSSTDGYSRQEVITAQPTSVNIGGNFYGQGVYTEDVVRVGSDYLEVALRDTRASQQYHQTNFNLGVEVDRMLSDQDTGLDKSLQHFFTSVGDLANSPMSESTRSVVLDSMSSLGSKFENMAYVLALSQDVVDKDLVAFTNRLNSLAGDLVNINDSLKQSLAKTGELSAQLVDARYSVLGQMSEIADISVFEDADGTAAVYVAGGMALVANNQVSPLTAQPDGFSDGQYEIYIRGVEVSDRIAGGKLGGTLKYRSEILNSSENEMGRIALGFTQMANVTHRQGFTPSGVAGGDLFANYSSVAQTHASNGGVGVMTVSFDTSGTVAAQTSLIGQLKATSYEVVDSGAGYDVFDTESGALLLSGAGASFTLDGLDFNMAGGTVVGDRFKISPMSDAIDGYTVVISSTQDFANSQDPLGSSSDNRNTLDLFDMKSTSLFNGGMDSFQGAYSTLVAKVGSKVATSESSAVTFSILKDQATLNRDTESGVNIEEEAASIMKLQQQYSAAAKIVVASRELFDELMHAIS